MIAPFMLLRTDASCILGIRLLQGYLKAFTRAGPAIGWPLSYAAGSPGH
jgi:hypothetical protein